MARRKLFNLVEQAVETQPLNKQFLMDIMTAIERNSANNSRQPSKWYKPSSLVCLRNMYFTRIGAETDPPHTEYSSISMADTGTRRHEAIQEVLMQMKNLGYDWEYVDVEQYINEKHKEGKCLSIKVLGKRGAETHLFDEVLKLSFMCDGIIKQLSTGNYFLFEFKNQVSFKYAKKAAEPGKSAHIDEEHHNQVICYCTVLDLDKAFVVYENRDTCLLECPEVFEVTQEMKNNIVAHIMECESYVERLIPPPKHENTKPCRWCPYQGVCRKAGN